MKGLGKIPCSEQYVPAGEEVVIDNSVAALAFFEKYYEKGGFVFLGTLRLFSLAVPELLVWMYFILDEDKPRLVRMVPAYKVEDFEAISRTAILQTIIHKHEIFFVYQDTLYSSLFTSEGETVIMKVRSLLNAKDAAEAISLMHGGAVENIYPVELYSHSEHKFVGVCWAVTIEGEDNKIFWYPMCLDETDKIGSYPMEDLSDHPIEVGETAVIGGETFVRRYTDDTGTFFVKKRKLSPEHVAFILDAIKQQREPESN